MSNRGEAILRVDWDDDEVEFLMDRCYYRGKPFTGVLFETNDSGGLRTEYEYVDGYEDGIQREWYLNGQLGLEISTWRHLEHGLSRRWNDKGQLESEYFSEYGVVLWQRVWDEDGRLVSDEALSLDPDSQKRLDSYRRDYGLFVQPLGPRDPKFSRRETDCDE